VVLIWFLFSLKFTKKRKNPQKANSSQITQYSQLLDFAKNHKKGDILFVMRRSRVQVTFPAPQENRLE